MESLEYFLPQVWFAILGLFLFLYVMLDGFDLGVGILSISAWCISLSLWHSPASFIYSRNGDDFWLDFSSCRL